MVHIVVDCFSGDECSDEKEDEEFEEEVGEDGEIILVSGDKVSGPWNKSGGGLPPVAAPVGEYTPLAPLVKPHSLGGGGGQEFFLIT